MRKMRNASKKLLSQNLKRTDHLEAVGVDRKIGLKK
jgi:hypothetical protein